ncbi:MAG: SDR family oxidoreductase [Verrucomicrobia bacterium]|nr:MAG: SDR family oxidoreductase [Verrucomicrobiota bacterium]
MKVAIIGANGKVGRRIVERMRQAADFDPIALVRSADQCEAFARDGIEARLIDLEGGFAAGLVGADAVVFTAGSGAHTGKDKTLLVDLWGAARVIRHCREHGPRRFIMISAIRAGDPDEAEGGIKPYLVAKWAADEYLQHSGLEWTILRPGRLLDTPGTGRVAAATRLSRRHGEIPRDDVAAAVLAALRQPSTRGRIFELLSGEEPVETALR